MKRYLLVVVMLMGTSLWCRSEPLLTLALPLERMNLAVQSVFYIEFSGNSALYDGVNRLLKLPAGAVEYTNLRVSLAVYKEGGKVEQVYEQMKINTVGPPAQ